MKKIVNFLKEKFGDKAPKVTLLIITKRIDDRFACLFKNKLENPKGGTIIENDVVKG